MRRLLRVFTVLACVTMLAGCATKAPQFDYSAFRAAKPVSMLVLPPVNDSPDIKATSGVWSHALRPLSEAGYYVLPASLVDESLRSNGILSPQEAHEIPIGKLRDEFGADAVVYIKISRYGTSYMVVNSETRVDVSARVVDLRDGRELWVGSAFASSAEQSQQSQGGLAGLLVAAVLKQIIGTTSDAAYNYAGIANARLLGVPRYNGILPGPRSPLAGVATPPQ
jgi:hypothetical protein